MPRAGYIPTDSELAAWIREESAATYPEAPHWGIGWTVYRNRHPSGWCGTRALARRFGSASQNIAREWSRIVRRLTGLHVPSPVDVAIYKNRHRELEPGRTYQPRQIVDMSLLDAPLPERRPRDPHPELAGYGVFDCIPKQRIVVAWHWPTREYRPVGYEEVYVVR